MIGKLLHTLISRLLLALIIVVYFIPILIIILLPERWRFHSKLVFWVVHSFFWLILKASFVPINYIGAEYLPHEPSIFVANHQSSFDIPLVGLLAKKNPHVWLATDWLMNSFLLRWIVPKMAVLVNTDTSIKAMRSLVKILKLVNGTNIHIMIFPEGGRFTDDEVHEFFGGFVILAKKTGRPVVPVRIFGANKVYPPKTFLVTYHPISVVVGKPMRMQEGESDQAFKDRVYNWFIEQKEQ